MEGALLMELHKPEQSSPARSRVVATVAVGAKYGLAVKVWEWQCCNCYKDHWLQYLRMDILSCQQELMWL
jgi:hypothetical protein